LAENQLSLYRKYNGRPIGTSTTTCFMVQMSRGEDPGVTKRIAAARGNATLLTTAELPDLKEAGTVGIYILCHTADMRTSYSQAAEEIHKEIVIKRRANLRKLSIACCNAADPKATVQGIMRDFCTALEKLEKGLEAAQLADGMMVSGFAATVTTFDIDPTFMRNDTGGEMYANAEKMRKAGTATGRQVGTVVQDHASHKIRFTHEKLSGQDSANLLRAWEGQLETLLRGCWDRDRDAILNKLKALVGRDCSALRNLSLDELLLTGAETLAGQVGVAKVDNFRKAIRTVLAKQLFSGVLSEFRILDNGTQNLRKDMEAYIKMKRVLRYVKATRTFEQATLAEYTDNRSLADILAFVERDGAKMAAMFFP
jgi:hypothetical protein